jgi:hypothetical protein
MTRTRISTLLLIVSFILVPLAMNAQEFPIAVGTDDTFSGGGAFDGTNLLMGIQGDSIHQNSMTAQFISPAGNLLGSRITLGDTGSGALIAFDGTNYLMVWSDVFPTFAGGDVNGTGALYGRFISTSGTVLGSRFTFETDVNIKQGRRTLIFADTTYFLTYEKGVDFHTDYIYGQRISKSGAPVGSPVQISAGYAREHSIAYDGANYLVTWCAVNYPLVDNAIYGQFVTPTGSLVGQNFLVDGSDNASDNPVNLVFDGSRYLVTFHDQAADNQRWNLIGRFITSSGVPVERFTICDSSKNPTFPIAAFDGTNYLITWMETAGRMSVNGRFYTSSGVPASNVFVVFDTLGGKSPIGGVGGFVNGHFFLSATRVDTLFTNGDIYGLLLNSLAAGVKDNQADATVGTFSLSQNYPNPFNPSTTIRFNVPERTRVRLLIFNVLGQQVAELMNEEVNAGNLQKEWNAATLPSGVYFCRMVAGTYTATRKMLLAK